MSAQSDTQTIDRLHEIHRGIYLVGHGIPPPFAREQAALLACHPKAILSHHTAANLWTLHPYPATAPVWVTVPPGRNPDRARIKARRATIPPRDTRQRHGLKLTSPPRTILDLAAHFPADDLERLVAEAHYRHLASEAELQDQLARNLGERGNAGLRRILGLPGAPQRTRSTAERTLLRLLREAAVTGYAFNQRAYGYELDVLWRGDDPAGVIDLLLRSLRRARERRAGAR